MLRALRARAPELAIAVRTQAPHWIFEERGLGLSLSTAPLDPGVIQATGLDVDREATYAAHADFLAGWDAAVAREADWLRDARASLVLADVPPLAFAAAAAAVVPAVAVANFTWDWIHADWARQEARFAPVAERYRRAYALAACAYRTPLSGGFESIRQVVDVPHVVNRSQASRADCRRRLGIAPDDPRRVVLVSFGGFGAGRFRGATDEELSAYRFVALDPGAPDGFPGAWTRLSRPSPLPHEDLMQACDAVIGKAGYGTVAEALAHGTRFLFLTRPGFAEVPVLERGLLAAGCARSMPRADFFDGRWRAHLDALFAQPPPSPAPACDGAERVAEALLTRLAGEHANERSTR